MKFMNFSESYNDFKRPNGGVSLTCGGGVTVTTLADIAQKIRSKNAGPFWITIDIFCSTADRYKRIKRFLSN